MKVKDFRDLGYCTIHPGKVFEGYCKECDV